MDNPYLDPEYIKNIENSFPEGHPARHKTYLTTLQSFAYPILLWFFDSTRNLGRGRTYLMAAVCIELAQRGQEVILEDLSIGTTNKSKEHMRRYFVDVIMNIIQKHHAGHMFEYNKQRNILIYRGIKPK